MTNLTKKQLARQDLVDNAIHKMMNEVSLNGIKIEWDMDKISWIRTFVQSHLCEEFGWSEQEFYPFLVDDEE